MRKYTKLPYANELYLFYRGCTITVTLWGKLLSLTHVMNCSPLGTCDEHVMLDSPFTHVQL